MLSFLAPIEMPPACRLGGRSGTSSGNCGNEHQNEGCQEEEREWGNNDNQNVMGVLIPLLQQILAWLGPHVEEHQHDQNWEEGSHHGDSHHSKNREEEREFEHSVTPLGGTGHHQGGQDHNSKRFYQVGYNEVPAAIQTTIV